jgi:hypothetical protein
MVISCISVCSDADERIRSLADAVFHKSIWKTDERAEDSYRIYGRVTHSAKPAKRMRNISLLSKGRVLVRLRVTYRMIWYEHFTN